MCGGQVSEHLEKTEYKMNKLFPGIFAMAIIVVASNILVQFFIGNWLTWGAFTYPFAFLVTDLINRMYGSGDARRVVFFGFIIGIVCSLIGTQINIEIAPDFMAPAVTLRIAIGSATAFLCAQLLDVTIFDRLRHGTWWSAPLVSTLIGSTLDTILFFFISFSLMMTSLLGSDHNIDFFNETVMGPLGFEQTRWIATAMVDWSVKVSIALVALIPFRMIIISYHARNN